MLLRLSQHFFVMNKNMFVPFRAFEFIIIYPFKFCIEWQQFWNFNQACDKKVLNACSDSIDLCLNIYLMLNCEIMNPRKL